MDILEIMEILGAYEEDKLLISLYKDAVIESLKELIPGLNEENLTANQKLLLLTYIQDFYDNRELYEERKTYMKSNFNSILLNEMYKGERNEIQNKTRRT